MPKKIYIKVNLITACQVQGHSAAVLTRLLILASGVPGGMEQPAFRTKR